MSGFPAKPGKEQNPTTVIQPASVPDAGDLPPEGIRTQKDAFWGAALESASLLLWIATHLANPEQSPFL